MELSILAFYLKLHEIITRFERLIHREDYLTAIHMCFYRLCGKHVLLAKYAILKSEDDTLSKLALAQRMNIRSLAKVYIDGKC